MAAPIPDALLLGRQNSNSIERNNHVHLLIIMLGSSPRAKELPGPRLEWPPFAFLSDRLHAAYLSRHSLSRSATMAT